MPQELTLTPKEDLPEGTLLLKEFARMCHVNEVVAGSHRGRGLSYRRAYGTFNRREHLEATAVLEGAKVKFYLTPEQQQKALIFWDKYRIKHRLPIISKQEIAS